MSTKTDKLPTKGSTRIETLDILRGFAVFGIFVVNIEIMNCTFFNQDVYSQQWTSIADKLSVQLLHLFFYSKFFPIFSFLFGLGISMQALKWLEKGPLPAAFFGRRMLFLFLLGIAHIVFLWSGDVLHLYALLGVLTAYLLRVPDKIILSCAILLLLFPFYDKLGEAAFSYFNFDPGQYLAGYSSEEITSLIRHGSYGEGLLLRLHEYVANIPLLFGYLAPLALSMFLLGLYFGKKKLVYSLGSVADALKEPVLAVAVITNAYRLCFLYVLPQYELYKAYRPLFLKLMFLSDTAMALFYLWLIVYLLQYPGWKKVLSPLKHVGRMALTNYIMHSVIGLLLFSSVGLQLYETMRPVETLLAAIGVFCFQLLFSKIWLAYFYYGPLEWAWRCFSYLKYLPNKRTAVPDTSLA